MKNKLAKIDFNIFNFNAALFLRAIILLTPVMLLFYQENGLSVSDLFLFQSIFYLSSILLEIPVGFLSDLIPKKNILLISVGIFLSVATLWLNFKGFYVILSGEILMSVSKVMMDNSMSGYMYDYLSASKKSEKMPKNYGYLNFCLALGTAVASIIGALIFSKYGSHNLLLTQICLITISILLILRLPSVHVPKGTIAGILMKFHAFLHITKTIIKNPSITSYIFYSGFLTAFSIMFALSFQPILLFAGLPVILFGIAAFTNHGVRALSGLSVGFFEKLFSIRSMIIPLYILYILAFLSVFAALRVHNSYFIMILISLICLIIGFQLLFTIRHVSRLHKFVESDNRGNIISVNNLCSRLLAFIVLFISKIFMDKLGFENFYVIAFCIFVIVGLILAKNAHKILEEC